MKSSSLVFSPKTKEKPHYRTPTHTVHPESFDRMSVRFRFDLIDMKHELWGLENLTAKDWKEMVNFFQAIETQAWGELKVAGGGRNHGTNHHSLEISQFSKKAQQRIRELNLEKIIGDVLFSFRMKNTTRLYGHREENFFRIIWFDPHHGNADKAAYPVRN